MLAVLSKSEPAVAVPPKNDEDEMHSKPSEVVVALLTSAAVTTVLPALQEKYASEDEDFAEAEAVPLSPDARRTNSFTKILSIFSPRRDSNASQPPTA